MTIEVHSSRLVRTSSSKAACFSTACSYATPFVVELVKYTGNRVKLKTYKLWYIQKAAIKELVRCSRAGVMTINHNRQLDFS
jgi:hypothetical protein